MNMQTAEIERDIRSFLVETFLFGNAGTLGNDEPLLGKVIDSHGVVELVVFLQDHFSITVEDEEVVSENLDSVNRVVGFVTGKVARNL
ncbi:MAG: acyl carrier protein [Terriglobales bacterium]